MSAILLIEDSKPIQDYLIKLIERMGHKVTAAGDADTGLQHAQQGAFQLIVCDLHLPGTLTGMDLVRAIHQAKPNCPIVIVSGYPSSEILDDCRELGITDFLTKPFEVSFLRSVVERILGKVGGPTA
jgi:CheY-like chemotaxis protein